MILWVVLACEMQTRASGGSRATEVTALAVMPCGVPSGSTVVMTVTPVAKRLHARRYSGLLPGSVGKFVLYSKFRFRGRLTPEGDWQDGDYMRVCRSGPAMSAFPVGTGA